MEQLVPFSKSSTLTEAVGDVTAVLLTGPTGDPRVTRAGMSLLSGPTPAESTVVWVTMTQSPSRVVQTWTDHVDEQPAAFEVIVVGEAHQRATDGPFDYSTTHVQSPADLTALGVRITEATGARGHDTADPSRPRVRFDSLSTLLQYVDLQTVFQFVHVLRGRLSNTEAVAQFHLDPAIHDTRTVRTLLSACDARVSVGADGLAVERR